MQILSDVASSKDADYVGFERILKDLS